MRDSPRGAGARLVWGSPSPAPPHAISTLEAAPPRGGKGGGGPSSLLPWTVETLGDASHTFLLQKGANGGTLLDSVWQLLRVVESDYFGLEFEDHRGNQVWLDARKRITKQVRKPSMVTFKMSVKFFPPDPGQLFYEFTRYLFVLQVRRDLSHGRLPCSDTSRALLLSYLLQAEVGDVTESSARHFLRTEGPMASIAPLVEASALHMHQQHRGQSPGQAELHLLDVARKLEWFGLHLVPTKARDGTPLHLAPTHSGIAAYRGSTKLNLCSWAKIRKLSFKRDRFFLKLHAEAYEFEPPWCCVDTLEFTMPDRDACKRLWKRCVETHAFFRSTPPASSSTASAATAASAASSSSTASAATAASAVSPRARRHRAALFVRGSAFRYSGRTQQQLIEHVKQNGLKQTAFTRKRHLPPRRSVSAQATQLRLPLTAQSSSFSYGALLLSSPHLHSCDVAAGDAGSGDAGAGDAGSRPESPSSPALASSPHSPPHRQHPRQLPHHHHHHLQQQQQQQQQPQQPQRQPQQQQQPRQQPQQQREHCPHRHGTAGRLTPGDADEVDDGARRRGSGALRASPSSVSTTSSSSSSSSSSSAGVPSPAGRAGRWPVAVSPPRVSAASPWRPDDVSASPSPPSLSPCLSDVSGCSSRTDEDAGGVGSGGHRKRVPADRAYFITKELLATERTYQRDLAAIVTCLGGGGGGGVTDSGASAAAAAQPPPPLLSAIATLQLLHEAFLRRVEQRMALWEGRSNAHLKGDFQRIGDILVHFIQTLKAQLPLLLSLESLQGELPPLPPSSPHASPPLCLPSGGGLLAKALQRPPHYGLLLARLCAHYPDEHPDRGDCAAALQEVSRITDVTQEVAARMENAEKLAALGRDVVGIGKLSTPGKVFVREGRLLKLTRSGPQQRMFFLFLDALIYTRRDLTAHNQFPVAGRIPLHGMILIVLEPPVASNEYPVSRRAVNIATGETKAAGRGAGHPPPRVPQCRHPS
ncbi:FERM, ARHGEF and pleckstrin domain-containing protein 1-like isoform X3 [Petromyzon marinus]|uniref:FERM, ARHGEF and pleckstrin domain-containing protein 1-like isoform X3 n=1 Tax=Petromyzon marinus TaxID=7757 RepID=UPI003F6ED9B9